MFDTGIPTECNRPIAEEVGSNREGDVRGGLLCGRALYVDRLSGRGCGCEGASLAAWVRAQAAVNEGGIQASARR
jgi:hypothetical protein